MLLSDQKSLDLQQQTLSESTFKPAIINSYQYQKEPQQCQECGLRFDSLPQLLNHRRRFCQNSGYDNLTGLLMKQTGRNDLKVNYKLGQHLKNVQKNGIKTKKDYQATNKMKKYGQYSLSKLKYDPFDDINNDNDLKIIDKKAQLLYDDMMGIQKHRNNLQSLRHYEINQKFSSSNTQANKSYQDNNLNQNYLSQKKHLQDFGNSKSVSSFSYRLDEEKFNKNPLKQSNAEYLQQLLLKNQQSPLSPPTRTFMREGYHKSAAKGQVFQDERKDHQLQTHQNIIPSKINPASIEFASSFQKPSLLNKSNASIANMTVDKKITYAKYKLDQLQQIKQLYLKNGGQSKEFKQNVQKMIGFYDKLLEDCVKNKDGINNYDGDRMRDSRLSISSRPQTPIMKLNGLNGNSKNKNNLAGDQQLRNIDKNKPFNTGRPDYPNSQNTNNFNQYLYNKGLALPPQMSSGMAYQQPTNNQNASYPPNFPYHYSTTQHDPSAIINQMYQMRMMEDILKSQSQQNRKLIEALLKGLNTKNKDHNGNEQEGNLTQSRKQKNKAFEEDKYRFGNEVDTMKTSEDRILKLLQEEELDQMTLISKLPVGLQDEKLQSLIKNSELRFKMEKQVLKQKLQRLSWQEKIQSHQEERQVKNHDWIGQNNKDVIKTQMNHYLNDFQQEFRPQYQ